MNKKLTEVCIVFCIVSALIFSIWTMYKSNSLGSISSDYQTVCIEGHGYYYASFMAKGFMAIKLSPEGLPVSCK